LTYIVTEMDCNKVICTHPFEQINVHTYVKCSNKMCTKPHKFVLQDRQEVENGHSFFCHGNEVKGAQVDRCFRRFTVTIE
jgi:hypothetical protein